MKQFYEDGFTLTALRLGEVWLQELHHPESLDLLLSKDGSHGFIRGEQGLVPRILQSFLLKVGPEFLDNLER